MIDWAEIADAFEQAGAPERIVDLLRRGAVEIEDIETSPLGHSYGGVGGTVKAARQHDESRRATASIGVKSRTVEGQSVYKGWSSICEPAICNRVIADLGRNPRTGRPDVRRPKDQD